MRNKKLTLEDFKSQFRIQIKFLRKYNSLMAMGDLDFARPAATAIRTIFHQTRSSTSLLTHLNATTVSVICEAGIIRPTPQLTWFNAYGLSREYRAPKALTITKYDTNDPEASRIDVISGPRPAVQWWNEIVFYKLHRKEGAFSFTRKDLILGATNSDGGAHVDQQLKSNYYTFLTEVMHEPVNGDTINPELIPYKNIEFIYIKHLAEDLLESPDFLQLGV